MENNREISFQDTGKRKLTNEELLAGKCAPEDHSSPDNDPRLKSPDDLLLQLLTNRKAPPRVRNTETAPASPLMTPVELPVVKKTAPSPLPSSFIQDLPKIEPVKSIMDRPAQQTQKKSREDDETGEPSRLAKRILDMPIAPWDIDEGPQLSSSMPVFEEPEAEEEDQLGEEEPTPIENESPVSFSQKKAISGNGLKVIHPLDHPAQSVVIPQDESPSFSQKEEESSSPLERYLKAEAAAAPVSPKQELKIKSPDEILEKFAPKKAAHASSDLSRELADLKDKYDREMARWIEYDQNVNHWKERVLQIVQHLKKEVADVNTLKAEVKTLREEIKRRDEEFEKFVEHQKKFFKKGPPS